MVVGNQDRQLVELCPQVLDVNLYIVERSLHIIEGRLHVSGPWRYDVGCRRDDRRLVKFGGTDFVVNCRLSGIRFYK